MLRSENRLAEAVKTFEELTSKYPSYVMGHYNLALAYWKNNERDKALNEVKEVLRIDPSFRAVIKGDGQFRDLKKESPEFVELISQNPPQ